jgi:hypothetical protein
VVKLKRYLQNCLLIGLVSLILSLFTGCDNDWSFRYKDETEKTQELVFTLSNGSKFQLAVSNDIDPKLLVALNTQLGNAVISELEVVETTEAQLKRNDSKAIFTTAINFAYFFVFMEVFTRIVVALIRRKSYAKS